MARAMWKGAIAFGLVNIPVELYSATRDHRPRFRLLHAKDESPVHYERVCQSEGKPVAWEDLVKGYEYEKGQFVVLTKDDFKTAALEKTKTIDILDFVDPERGRRALLRDAVLPAAGQGRRPAYALIREAIRDAGKIGIAKIILRDAQHLAAVEAIGDALVLTMMRFADELADLGDFTFPPKTGDIRARRAEDGEAAGREPQREMGAGEIHRRIPRQPDARHQRQAERQDAAAEGARDAAAGRGHRSDGAPARQPRGHGRGKARPAPKSRRAAKQARRPDARKRRVA